MLRLRSVYEVEYAETLLYSLLGERTPEQSISHKAMPEWKDHCEFFDSIPYEGWYLVEGVGGACIGMCYVTHQDEIGLALFKQFQGKGYGSEVVQALRARHPGKLLANVNPDNVPSRKLWEKLGGKLIQVTYELPEYSPPAKRVKLTGEAFGGQTEWTQ